MADQTLGVPEGDLEVASRRLVGAPRVAVVLGSGWGGFADEADVQGWLGWDELPNAPRVQRQVPGHAGRIGVGRAGGTDVLVFSGRVHGYQGVPPIDVVYPVRLCAALGVETVVITNAAGSVNPEFLPGAAVLISDQINLTGQNPLIGWPGPLGGDPFVPMTDAYDPALRVIAADVARTEGLELHDGVYIGLRGPSFETVAEARYLRGIGGDVVGMSTVLETIAARALGLRVLGLSLVTNVAAGSGLEHTEVLKMAAHATPRLSRLLTAILARLCAGEELWETGA